MGYKTLVRLLRRIALAVVALLVAAGGWVWWRLGDRPDLAAYDRFRLTAAPASGPQVRVTFLGVSTLLIDDGATALLVDGFFTRPAKMATLFGRIAPDPRIIDQALTRWRLDRIAAVIVVHSHYDHAMDAPEVARRTGALLVGSESTANIGRGWGLPAERIRVATPGAPMAFGAFRATLIPSRHFPHGMAMGEITAPLVPPVRADAYREGGSYSLLIEHPLGTLLVQGSAGWLDGALAGRRADVVLLGIGGMGARDETYRDTYYREVVDAVGAGCVVPVHWDDFTLPLDEPLRPMPRLLDDVAASLAFLARRTAERGIGFGLLPAWQPTPLLGSDGAACRPAVPRPDHSRRYG